MSDSDEPTELEALIGWDEQRRLLYEAERTRNWVRFGPVYGEDTENNRRVKDSAWQHILYHTGVESEITECQYLSSIEEIEEEAMKGYGESTLERLRGQPVEYFRSMMAKDGCLFLQLALHIIGAGELLGYPSMHPYFGEKIGNSKWIPDMLWSGNQIPYVVIDALMNQAFFKNVIDTKADWMRPPEDDAVKLALYQTVVEPQLMTKSKKPAAHHHLPSFSIIAALRNVLLGSDEDYNPDYAEMREFRDLELGYIDKGVRFPSATELSRSGVKLIKNARIGITNIVFKNRGYSAVLYLPPFHIHSYTVDLFTSVVQHELSSLTETDRKVTSYVRFMRDLAPTYKDFKHLQDRGIIQVHDKWTRGTVIHALHELVSRHRSNFTPKFNELIRGIKEYETVPWNRISFTCSIACGIITFFLAVFTIVQTVFTLLSYYDKPT